MNIFKYFCHQQPERSFYIKNYKFPVCARCTGFYISMIIYIILAMMFPIQYTIGLILFGVLLIIPSIVDGTTQYFYDRESNNLLRLITGLMGGTGLMILIKTIKFMFIYS